MVRSCVEGCMVSENQTKSRFIESRLDLTSSRMEKERGEHVGPLSLPRKYFFIHTNMFRFIEPSEMNME